MSNNIRLRFAPSPTGPLHIGGLRTALYNYLISRKLGGKFILRIEDTDLSRLDKKAIEHIENSLNWCGIIPDESPKIPGKFGPYFQSQRKDLYRKYVDKLIKKGSAYYAFDKKDELNVLRKNKEKEGKTFIYNWFNRDKLKNSLSLSNNDSKTLINKGEYVVRFKSYEPLKDKNEYTCATTESYILKDTITSNDLLGKCGNKVPGIDFYRNNRMCNTKYPISKIGNVGTLLQKGQMRGKRCHIITHFNDKKVSETKSFDDFIGVTTVKDIYEDDRMEKSLINIFEQIAEKCAIDYEEYINKQKLGVNKYLSDIKNYLSVVRYNDKLLMGDTILETYKNDLTNYTNHKLSYYDENEDKIIFAKNKQDVELQKKNGNSVLRKNSGPITQSIELLRAINDLINNKIHLIHKRDEIQQISSERNINYIEAENIYNIQEKTLIEQNKIKEENKKKLLQREIEKIHAEKRKKEEEAQKLDLIKEKEKQETLEKKKKEIEKKKIQKLNDLQLQVKQVSIEELQKVWINYMMNK